jgi:hypothetical protein
MEILRKYVMGSSPVRVQVLSDQSIHFGRSGSFNRVNWEDPHYNIGAPLPVCIGDNSLPAADCTPLPTLLAAHQSCLSSRYTATTTTRRVSWGLP